MRSTPRRSPIRFRAAPRLSTSSARPTPTRRRPRSSSASTWSSIRASAAAAVASDAAHIVYVSVARPAPLMRSYIDARARGEAAVAGTGIPHTFVRPWYGRPWPGHYWPYMLVPLYALARMFPPADAQAGRSSRPGDVEPDGDGARRSCRDAAGGWRENRRRSRHRTGDAELKGETTMGKIAPGVASHRLVRALRNPRSAFPWTAFRPAVPRRRARTARPATSPPTTRRRRRRPCGRRAGNRWR